MHNAHITAMEGFLYHCIQRVIRVERGSPDALEDRPRPCHKPRFGKVGARVEPLVDAALISEDNPAEG